VAASAFTPAETAAAPGAAQRAPQLWPEVRFLIATAVAAVALALAALEIVAWRTDALLLDFRDWRPVAAAGAASADGAARFAALQQMPPDRRPFFVTLQVGAGAGELPAMAVGRRFAVRGDGPYCFRVLAQSPAGVAGADAAGAILAVAINGDVVRRAALEEIVGGAEVVVDGIAPRGGGIDVRLQLAINPATTAPGPFTVHFEYASLRRCASSPISPSS
jgi:hypothetical protein